MPQQSRARLVARLRAALSSRGHPRLVMTLLVAATGAAGFAGSILLLPLGLEAMWLRYPAAALLAYLVFLFLLWVWLRAVDLPLDLAADNSADAGNRGTPPGRADAAAMRIEGSGGEFGGAGVSGGFEAASGPTEAAADAGKTAAEAVVGAADSEGCLVVIGGLVVIAGVILAASYVVYAAPAILAELVLDAALAAGLYRRLARIERRNWLATAVRRTAWPFAVLFLTAMAGGWILGTAVPGARTLGECLGGL